MTDQQFFSPGQTIVLREVLNSRIWSAKPVIVVQDTPEMLAVYAPSGTMTKQPRTLEGKRVKAGNRLLSEWKLIDNLWSSYHLLRMTIPGSIYSVLTFWENPSMEFHDWYINLEDPLNRTALGFEYLDQWLDVIVAPDLSNWHWKDEDEFKEAIEVGLISKERAATLRTEGERVAKWIQSGKSPFNGWENWRPDPSWKIPVLPDGWDVL
jgi:predicted RNA-binding protein associated with RNAse of E/G family